jgi:integrase
MVGLGKQAKILTDKQIAVALAAVAARRYPLRDRVIILLSVRAGLRAKEVSNIRWAMVADAQGAVTDTIHLVNGASKGKHGGREIPMAKDLRQALVETRYRHFPKSARDLVV